MRQLFGVTHTLAITVIHAPMSKFIQLSHSPSWPSVTLVCGQLSIWGAKAFVYLSP